MVVGADTAASDGDPEVSVGEDRVAEDRVANGGVAVADRDADARVERDRVPRAGGRPSDRVRLVERDQDAELAVAEGARSRRRRADEVALDDVAVAAGVQ